jgi:hypothetical protein
MAERAQVRSVDALESFRSHLILYVSKARPALDEVSADVARTRMWLEDEQRTHWENEVKRRRRAMEEAEAALFSARLSTFREETSAEQMAVHRSKRAFDEAESKLMVLKKWNREYDNRVEPLLKQMEKLQTVLARDMVLAIAYLAQAINTLHAYAKVGPPTGATGPASPPGPGIAGESGGSETGAGEPGAPGRGPG